MTPTPRPPARAAARLVLAAAAAGAGLIHFAVAPAHLAEYRPLGIAFVVAGVLQLLWAAGLLRRDSVRLLRVGAAGSLVFVGAYLVSRTVGLPFGPAAMQAEPLGTADLVCCGLEVVTALGALALSSSPRLLVRPLRAGTVAVTAALLLGVTGGTGVALAAPPAHQHQHGHEGPSVEQAPVEQGPPAAARTEPAPAGHAHSCPDQPVLTGKKDARGVDTGVTAYFACQLHEAHAGHAR